MPSSVNVTGWPALGIEPVVHIFGERLLARTEHTGKMNWWKSSKTELQRPQEGFDINPQPLGSHNFKSSPPNQCCILLPATCI